MNSYEILGVNVGATKDEIKKAYLLLAKKHHPDRNGGSEESNAKFKEISEAYQKLINNDTPFFNYDNVRNYKPNTHNWDRYNYNQSYNQRKRDDFFEDNWEFKETIYKKRSSYQSKKNRLDKVVSISISNIYKRKEVVFSYRKKIGGAYSIFRIKMIPPEFLFKDIVRVKLYNNILNIIIIVGLKIKNTKTIYSIGNDVYIIKKVSQNMLIKGGNTIVQHPDGRKIKLRLEPNSNSGKLYKIKSEGLFNEKYGNTRGNIYFKVILK